MNLKERRRFDMLARVYAFGVKRPDAFPPSTMGRTMFVEVGNIVTDVSQEAAARMSCERTLRTRTADRVSARKRLRKSLRAIHRTALALAIDAPGIDRRFRVPRSRGDRAWLATARAFALPAKELAPAFVAYGLPATFVDDLSADIGRLDRAIRDVAAARKARASARAQLRQHLRRAFVTLRRLDAVVPNVMRADPAELVSWRSARRLLRNPKRRVHLAKTLRPVFRAA